MLMATQQQRVLCELVLCVLGEVMIVLLLLTAAGGWRKPAGRYGHSTAVVGEEVYLWAGWQDRLPGVHDSDEKRAFLSSVEVFNVNHRLYIIYA